MADLKNLTTLAQGVASAIGTKQDTAIAAAKSEVISEVRTTVIKEVISDATNGVDISDLASKNYVDSSVSVARAALEAAIATKADDAATKAAITEVQNLIASQDRIDDIIDSTIVHDKIGDKVHALFETEAEEGNIYLKNTIDSMFTTTNGNVTANATAISNLTTTVSNNATLAAAATASVQSNLTSHIADFDATIAAHASAIDDKVAIADYESYQASVTSALQSADTTAKGYADAVTASLASYIESNDAKVALKAYTADVEAGLATKVNLLDYTADKATFALKDDLNDFIDIAATKAYADTAVSNLATLTAANLESGLATKMDAAKMTDINLAISAVNNSLSTDIEVLDTKLTNGLALKLDISTHNTDKTELETKIAAKLSKDDFQTFQTNNTAAIGQKLDTSAFNTALAGINDSLQAGASHVGSIQSDIEANYVKKSVADTKYQTIALAATKTELSDGLALKLSKTDFDDFKSSNTSNINSKLSIADFTSSIGSYYTKTEVDAAINAAVAQALEDINSAITGE